jgi:hypothetical protein
MKSAGAVTVSVDADSAASLGTYRVPLSPGWNLVGVPADSNVIVDSLRLDRGGASVAFSQAVQSGWVRGVVFEFDPTAGSYVEALGFEPWSAYWIRCIVAGGCNLVFFEPVEATSRSFRPGAGTVAERLRAAGASVAELRIRHGAASAFVVLATLTGAGAGIDPEWDSDAPPTSPGSSFRAGVERCGDLLAVDADSSPERLVTAGGLDPAKPVTLEVTSGAVRLLSADGLTRHLAAGERVGIPSPGSSMTWHVAVER